MEEEYTVIKSQSKIQDNQATMKFLLIMNVLMMLPGLMSGIQIEFYIGAASIGLIVFLFIIQRWIKSYVQLITILLLLSYSVTRYVVVDKNYEAAIKGVLFFNGYSVASTQFIIMSRLHNVYLRILAGFIAYGLRIGVMVGIVDHRLLSVTLLIRQFIIDAFIVYMFYSNDKVDRRIFQNYYENREELVKFKELLADSLPQSVTILDAKTQKPLFCNNFFANTFSLSPNNQLDTDVAHDNLTRDDVKPSLSSLRVDIHTIRETHSTEGYIVLKSFSSSSPYLEEVLERLLEENTLESKTLSLTAAYKHETQRRLFEIIFKRIKWDRVEAVAVILNDITYQENLLTLKVANKNKDKLIATVSHELRTPLHGIIGVLQTVEKKQEGKESAEYLSLCKNHAYLLLSLVNSIVDFHQIETGKLRLNPAKVEIRTALREFLKPFEFQCKAKNILLEMEVDKDVPTYIITDENRLNQIFVNLLNNAVKFTFYGRIKIEASQDPKNTNCLLISVRDTGIGIKGQDLGYLFKTSKTWGDKESVGKSGVGLGLTMSNTLALLLNGRKDGIGIEVDSEYGRGSCFSFRILKNLDAFQELEFQIGKEVGKEEQLDEREQNEMEKKKKISWNREIRKYEQDEDSIESNCYERSNLSVDLQSKMASYLSLRKGGNQDGIDQINSFKTNNNEKMATPKDVKLLPRNESLDNFGLFTLEQPKPELQEEPKSSLQLFQNECILVVDDYPFNLLVAKNLLKNFGYAIKVAMGGQEAIEMVKICSQNGQTIKVILMDCQMPVIDGYETTRILIDLMNKKEIPRIPILAWTANNSEEDIQRCYESGMVGHLSKPTSQDALKNALEKLPNSCESGGNL